MTDPRQPNGSRHPNAAPPAAVSHRTATVTPVTGQGVLAVPDERFIRDELQRLVLADLHGPLGGPEEEFPTEENPLDRYILGRLAPNGVIGRSGHSGRRWPRLRCRTCSRVAPSRARRTCRAWPRPRSDSPPAWPPWCDRAAGRPPLGALRDGRSPSAEEHAGRRVWRRRPARRARSPSAAGGVDRAAVGRRSAAEGGGTGSGAAWARPGWSRSSWRTGSRSESRGSRSRGSSR